MCCAGPTMTESSLLLGLLVTTVLAAAWDVRTRRIPNFLTVGGLAVALVLRGLPGPPGLLDGVAAAALGFLFSIPFFAAGGLGGGDVKLMTAVAAFLGLDRLMGALLIMALVGVCMALVAVARRGVLLKTLANVHLVLLTLGRRTFTGWRGEESEAAVHMARDGAITIPYGVAIGLGGIGGWFWGIGLT